MNFTEAKAFVSLRAAQDQEPTISDEQVAQLLNELAVTTDSTGLEPDEEGWTATYSRLGCHRVLAEVWEIKAGEVSHRFDFLAPTSGGLFKLSQIHDHCEAQARKWRNLVNHSVSNAD